MRKLMVGTLGLMLALALLPNGAHAAILRVNGASAAGSPDGLTWGTAFPTLQAALAAAVANDEIWVAAGTYTPGAPGGDRSTTSFAIGKNLGLYGGFISGALSRDDRNPAVNRTVLSGDLALNDDVDSSWLDNCCCVIQVNGGAVSVTLDGFTISNAFNDGGTTGNDSNAGGIYAHEDTALTILNCTFAANTVYGMGAGVYCLSAHLTMEQCRFEGNSASAGGGIALRDGTLDAKRCLFVGNNGEGAGAYIKEGSNASFENCVFADNTYQLDGGGIYNDSNESMCIVNCTFSGNVTWYPETDFGGAISNRMTPTTVKNSVLWGNVPDEISNQDAVCTVTYSVVEGGYEGEGNRAADPLLRLPNAPWPYELSGGSSAIDTATADGAPIVDIAGTPRPRNAAIDMGAYEFGTDTDNNGLGLPDDYEMAHDLNPADPADDAVDSDQDGLSNLEEYRRYTDPHNENDPPKNYYVDPAGINDVENGTAEHPWQSIGYAMQHVPEGTPTFLVTIHLAAGTYTEKVVFRPHTYIVGAGSDTTIIEYYEEGAEKQEVVAAAAGCGLKDCTVRFAQPVTEPVAAHLLRIDNVDMFVQHVVFDGMDSMYAIGVFVTGTGSSPSVIRNCTIKRVKYGIWAVDSGINVTRNVFQEILVLDGGTALFIDPPEGAEPTAAPMLGSATAFETTGFNTFLMDSGYFIVNRAGTGTSAQYNYWGNYTEAEINARIGSGDGRKAGNVTITPYVGRSLLGASVVVAVQSQSTNDAIADTYSPKAAIGTTEPSRDPASLLFIFPALTGGMQNIQVTANQHTGQSRSVNVIPGDIIAERFALAFIGGEGEGEGEDHGCFGASGTLQPPSAPPGDGWLQAGVLIALLCLGRRRFPSPSRAIRKNA